MIQPMQVNLCIQKRRISNGRIYPINNRIGSNQKQPNKRESLTMKNPNSKNPICEYMPKHCIACSKEKLTQVYFCNRCKELYPKKVLHSWFVAYIGGAS